MLYYQWKSQRHNLGAFPSKATYKITFPARIFTELQKQNFHWSLSIVVSIEIGIIIING